MVDEHFLFPINHQLYFSSPCLESHSDLAKQAASHIFIKGLVTAILIGKFDIIKDRRAHAGVEPEFTGDPATCEYAQLI